MKRKSIALFISISLVLVGVIGVTIAWLISQSEPVNNTFTVGNINITLDESKVGADGKIPSGTNNRTQNNAYKMIPGYVFDKDPVVTVKANSEPCWLFVKIEESGGVVTLKNVAEPTNFDSFLSYGIADGWNELPGEENVYYRTVEQLKSTDQPFYIIRNNQITVNPSVTKEMMDKLTAAVNSVSAETTVPTLTFNAYAIQLDYTNDTAFASAKVAWDALNAQN